MNQIIEESQRYGDVKLAPGPPDFEALIHKTYSGVVLFREHNFVMKADDDTYVDLPRIMRSLLPLDYMYYIGHFHLQAEVRSDGKYRNPEYTVDSFN